MRLLNPHTVDYKHLDEKSRNLMKQTIAFFESKGKARIKEDDHNTAWYADFLEFQAREKIFATLMTPAGYGAPDSEWNTARICDFNEILGFYGLAYWYTWQVTMLGLGPIWMSSNEIIKKRTADLLRDGGIFAFGLSEKEHGADLIASDMKLVPDGDGRYLARGRKYYIGNANKAALVSTFGRMEGNNDYVFFAVASDHEKYECIQNVVHSQNYVAEYELHDYPITPDDMLSTGREAWDASLSTVAICKYNLGWASIGICTHAFYESINHAANRVLFRHAVTDFPHIRQFFVDAYARLMAMKMFASRAADYMRASSEEDKRYLLYNPLVKMKVTMQGEEVINLLWDIIAAKGFEKNMYFEMAARDIRALPKLEGTAQVNMVLVIKFIDNFLFHPAEYPEVPRMTGKGNDEFLFKQGATSKGQNKIQFHDYKQAYSRFDLPNIRIFMEQVEVLKELLQTAGPDRAQQRDLDFMLILGELFTLVPYGQLILEIARLEEMDADLIDQIFDFMVRDFTRYAVQLYSKTSSTPEQMQISRKMIRKPEVNQERYGRVWERHVFALKDVYNMKP
ncbi:MAG: acyl-CoA dehydrogenase [Leptospiraceae bacterium]|nr:acyl-CoA dehydrogenase [Leptospiraceae bacterium]MCB1315455.1 acyl-CoA dehydrogenase [Leptospiraceae bacterium]MCB1323352.1 acyl-CoA dehydrogenase [Leptospiraceae bacterium]